MGGTVLRCMCPLHDIWHCGWPLATRCLWKHHCLVMIEPGMVVPLWLGLQTPPPSHLKLVLSKASMCLKCKSLLILRCHSLRKEKAKPSFIRGWIPSSVAYQALVNKFKCSAWRVWFLSRPLGPSALHFFQEEWTHSFSSSLPPRPTPFGSYTWCSFCKQCTTVFITYWIFSILILAEIPQVA